MTPKLSIIVCTYNRANLLLKSLEALLNQTISKDIFEIIIVDNNSNDNTKELLQQFLKENENVKYFLEERQGLSHARNKGLNEAAGKFIAYIDDDARAVANWAKIIIDTFENINPQPVSVGGKYLPWYEENPPKWFVDDFEIRSWGEERGFLHGKSEKHGFSGSNMAFLKSFLVKYSGFTTDPGIMSRNLGEEVDLNLKIYKDNINRQNSIFWYDPDLIIYHYTPKKNFEFNYIKKRSFNAGISMAVIEQANFNLNPICKNLISLFIQPVVLLKNIFEFKLLFKTNMIKYVKKINYLKGYLGKCLNLVK